MSDLDININGAVFVLTGRFQADVTARLVALGGRVDARVSNETHYLVLSYWDSEAWDQDELKKARRLVGAENSAMMSVIREDGLLEIMANQGKG